jgi:hypothetical protein
MAGAILRLSGGSTSSLLMWRRSFLTVSTPKESDHIFTPFYRSGDTRRCGASSSFWLGNDTLCLRRLFYGEHVDQHEDRKQPTLFPEERTGCSGGRNRWDGTSDGKFCGFSIGWT